MISPMTPAGTRVCCIDASYTMKFVKNYIVRRASSLDGLREGEIYTVSEILPTPYCVDGYQVVLAEITRREPGNADIRGFALSRFRALPDTITRALRCEPVPKEEVEA